MIVSWQADVLFDFYDRPVLFLNWIGGKAALFVAVGSDDPREERFLVAVMPAAAYWLLWSNVHDLRTAFLGADRLYLMTCDDARDFTPGRHARLLAVEDVSEDWLPLTGTTLR